jgi:hypothetical protein
MARLTIFKSFPVKNVFDPVEMQLHVFAFSHGISNTITCLDRKFKMIQCNHQQVQLKLLFFKVHVELVARLVETCAIVLIHNASLATESNAAL